MAICILYMKSSCPIDVVHSCMFKNPSTACALALADMFDSKVCTWFMDELSSESEYASVDDAESNEAEAVSVPESSVRRCFLIFYYFL